MESFNDHQSERAFAARLRRCLLELVTAIMFVGVFVMGLSLITAGVFEEQVNVEAEARVQFDFKTAFPVGSVMVLYSLIGIVIEFRNRLHGKVSL